MLILDGKALIYRSFYALPPTMSTKNGELVNAVYGFTTVLIKAILEFKPDHIVLTMDKKGPTFRHERYEDYKATREKAPDDLYEQIPRIKEVASAFGIPTYEQQEYEADDLIGSIAEQTGDEIEKIIVTGDLDTLQLVDDNTKVYTMSRGVSESTLYDKDKVKERYGLDIDQLIDLKALAGDSSDNIPGVKGIGEKTATKLLQEFGDLDKLYECVESEAADQEGRIKPNTLKLLRENKERAYLSRDLATIRKEVDMDFTPEKAKFDTIDEGKVIDLFSELEFQSLIPRLKNIKKEVGVSVVGEEEGDKFDRNERDFNYHIIGKEEDFRSFLEELQKQDIFTFDVETTMHGPMVSDLLGISFSWKQGEAYYVYLGNKEKKEKQESETLFNYSQEKEEKEEKKELHPWLEELRPIFEDNSIKKIGHNIKFDVRVIQSQGIDCRGIYFDTMIASYLLNPGSRQHSLDAVVFTELGFEKIDKNELLGKGKEKCRFEELELRKLGLYSCEDADFTHRLIEPLTQKLQQEEMYELFLELEMPLVWVLAVMENNGVLVDTGILEGLKKRVSSEINKLEERVWELAGAQFNISSPQQLEKVLFQKLEIPTDNISKTKTGYSTAASELEKIRHEHKIVPLIQQHRELEKLLNTYIEVLPKLVHKDTRRIHTSYNQTVTATGRLSSTDPNLQNMPIRTELGGEIRKAFIAPAGKKILSLDYSQIELRLAAHLSGDKKMIEYFKEEKDIHTATAAEINNVDFQDVTKEMRREAKAINFGLLYGQGPHGLAATADIPVKKAKQFIKDYFELFQGVKEYIDKCVSKAEEKGYVETMWGRKRYLPEIYSQVPQARKSAERIAINTPLQGSSADMIKKAMIDIQKMIEADHSEGEAKMLIQVHDELLFEIREEELRSVAKKIRDIMAGAVNLEVPIKVDISEGDNWGELQGLSLE